MHIYIIHMNTRIYVIHIIIRVNSLEYARWTKPHETSASNPKASPGKVKTVCGLGSIDIESLSPPLAIPGTRP